MPSLTVNGVALHYRELGNRAKPPLVCLHTVLWGAETFDQLISTLTADYHLFVLDLHGHGASGYRTPLTIEDLVEDYAQLLKQLGLFKVIWIGYSLGSMIGMRLALQHPTLIERLVLIATSARSDTSPVGQQAVQLWELFRAGERATIIDAALQFFFAPATYQSQPQLIEAYRHKALQLQDVEGMYQTALASFHRTSVIERLSTLQAPTLIIAGRADMMATPAETTELATLIPHAQSVIIEEASHLLLVEKPQAAAQVIGDFLQTNVPASVR